MTESEEFNTLTFEKRLAQLKDTQESIQSLSSWCLKQREHHKKIVSSWLNVLKRVKIEQRLVLFYLANDVIQYSKRKNYEFVESWGLNLQKATPLVRDEKVRHKILRIFKIWEQRAVYDEEFLSDLTGLLSAGSIKKTDDDPLDFQPQQLVNKIKQCSVLEADTDLRLKCIHENPLNLSDTDALCSSLKDRSNKDDVEKELNEGISCVEKYTQALQREIVAREALLALLSTANQYYSTQRGEVKVVAYAYKNFGARVRTLKRKLDELIPTLHSAAPSPPRRDEDVPSPGPDEDLDLPGNDQAVEDDVSYNIDRTFNTSISTDGALYNLGLSSFLSSDNPMALFNEPTDTGITGVNANSNKIEVINNRPSEKQDFNINDFLKTLVPNENSIASDNNSVASGTISQKSQDALPGLDLLTPEGAANTIPTSFYGALENLSDEPEPYRPENPHWSNSWNVPAVPPPTITISPSPPGPVMAPRNMFVEPPASPPPAPLPPPVPPPVTVSYSQVPVLAPRNMYVEPPASTPPASLPTPVTVSYSQVPVLAPRNMYVDPPASTPPPVPAPVTVTYSQVPVLAPRNMYVEPPASPPPAPLPPPGPPPVTVAYSQVPVLDPRNMYMEAPASPPAPVPPPVTMAYSQVPVLDPRNLYMEPPASPPAPVPPPVTMAYSQPQDLAASDVDHRGALPPPPPPPVLPMLANLEDVDHRLLPSLPPPVAAPQNRHSPQQDVDHRNLISLTNMRPEPRSPIKTHTLDQDYRVPPLVPPNDIVESVDMDLSEDEELQNYQGNKEQNRRNSFNNNKVLVGGDNGKTNHKENSNLVQLNRNFENSDPPPSHVPPLSNPFENMPPELQFNMPFQNQPPYPNQDKEDSVDSAYDEDLRSRGIEQPILDRNPSPPEGFEMDWQNQRQFNVNQRFPRNWGPRTNFRPQFGPPMWPRGGPRPPNRWNAPRPQRFW